MDFSCPLAAVIMQLLTDLIYRELVRGGQGK